MLSLLPQLLVSGIAIGMLYALIALSMTILYRATTVVNFGHGDLVMAGAYMVMISMIHITLPFIPALILSLAALFGFGYLLHRAFIWPIITGPHLSLAMMAHCHRATRCAASSASSTAPRWRRCRGRSTSSSSSRSTSS